MIYNTGFLNYKSIYQYTCWMKPFASILGYAVPIYTTIEPGIAWTLHVQAMCGFRHIIKAEETLLTASSQRIRLLLLPGSMLKHIFNKYPIAFGGILDKDMRYCTNHCAILNDWRTWHTLDYSTC